MYLFIIIIYVLDFIYRGSLFSIFKTLIYHKVLMWSSCDFIVLTCNLFYDYPLTTYRTVYKCCRCNALLKVVLSSLYCYEFHRVLTAMSSIESLLLWVPPSAYCYAFHRVFTAMSSVESLLLWVPSSPYCYEFRRVLTAMSSAECLLLCVPSSLTAMSSVESLLLWVP